MTVFVSRFKRAYARRRSVRQLVLAVAGILMVMLLMGFAAFQDDLDSARCAAVTSGRYRIVDVNGEPQVMRLVPLEGR